MQFAWIDLYKQGGGFDFPPGMIIITGGGAKLAAIVNITQINDS